MPFRVGEVLMFLERDVEERREMVEPAGEGGTGPDCPPPIRALAMDICWAVMPPPAREEGRVAAARAAFWRVEVLVLRTPFWRREGPDMAPG